MAASADWVSRMECSRATGSDRDRRSFSLALVSAPTVSCCNTRLQGVAGGLQRLVTTEPLRVFSISLKDGWE